MKVLTNHELIHVSGGADPMSVPGATVYWGGEANRGRPPEDTSLVDWATLALAAALGTYLIIKGP